jgi:hypothetical protein
MTRHRMALTLTTAALALTACTAAPAADVADVAVEAYALQEVGLETGLAEAAAPAPSASAADGERRRGPAARRHLRKNTLHGEFTVQGKDGVRTVVVQRGAVTAVDGRAVTVKSADGWTLTWTLASDVRVRQDRTKADVAAVRTGAQVGVAGARDGDTATARLVVVG